MVRRLLFLFIFLFAGSAFTPAQARDLTAFEKRQYVGSAGTVLPYRILLPQNYDRSKKYPLVVFLHGAGERGNNNESQLVHGGSLFIKDINRKSFPAVVVFPQCPADSSWAAVNLDRNVPDFKLDFNYSRPITAPLKAVIELTQTLTRDEAVDSKRVYIMGLSMGAMGTFEAVYRNPEVFAAAIAICGGGDSKAYDQRVKHVAFWIFHGSADDVVEVKFSREMYERLKELKADAKYTEYHRVGHESWTNAFAESNLLKWLFSKRKD